MKKLLITGAWRYTEKEYNELLSMGYDITLMPDERGALPKGAVEAEVIICNGLFLYHDPDLFPRLQAVQLTSAGLDRVPMDKMKARGIAVFNARGVYSVPMAEYALFGVLSLYKQGRSFHENQKAVVWEKRRDVLELFGKTVCIVGCGSVGTECARRFAALGCTVTGVDLFPREDATYEKMLPLSALDGALSEADIVILTLPLTDETRHLMNDVRIAKMKQGSVLVNITRGAVVDEEALLSALDGHLLGAVLDVFETEPLPKSSPLWQKENVIITPHNSFVGDGNGARMFAVIKSNLKKGIK